MANKKDKFGRKIHQGSFQKVMVPDGKGRFESRMVPKKMTLEEEIIQKIRQRAPKKKAIGGLMGKGLTPAGLGAVGRGIGSRQKRRKMPEAGLQEKKQNAISRQRLIDRTVERIKKFKKKPSKPAIPLGKMKKQGPKPGTMDYFLQETMKPGYKVPPMATGGPTFGKMLDKKFIKYAGSKQAQLHAKDYDEGLDRAERRAALETKQAYKKNKKTEKKLMGGGMMKKPMGYTTGGMCKGMGAAIRGGNFKGVK